MTEEVLIDVQRVSKRYCRDLKRSLWYGLQDLGNELRGRRHSVDGRLRRDEFWAIRDVSFQVKRGECVGLVGRNGAGKSTLLKILTGLLKPDEGRVALRGRVGALIELGGGFNPILSGRENIYIGGAVLGFSRKEMSRKVEEIIDFSELEPFIDMPVKSYSSGMKVRLGFSIASNLDPDVLFLDEVLAVGDAGFRIKSFNKIAQVIRSAAVIFVSHQMSTVSRVSSHVLLLRDGGVGYHGDDVAHGIEQYMGMFAGEVARVEYNDKATIDRFKIFAQGQEHSDSKVPSFSYLDDIYIEMDVSVVPDVERYAVRIQITDKDMKIVAIFWSDTFGEIFCNRGRSSTIRVHLPEVMLTNGHYSVTVFLHEFTGPLQTKSGPPVVLATYRHWGSFKMQGFNGTLWAPFHLKGRSVLQRD